MSKSKLELILEMRNRMKVGISRAKKQVSGAAGEMRRELHSVKQSAAQAFSAAKEEIPGLTRAIELGTNKYILMTAAVVALSTASVKLGHHLFDIEQRVTTSQKSVQAIFGLTGQELMDTTGEIRAVSKILKVEERELSTAANALRKEYEDTGLSISDSINLVKTGLQSTGGLLELREIQEYSSQMKAAGLSAQEFIALAATARKQGVFDDKAPDAVKEFNLRLREMTPAARDALKGIGLSSSAILKGLNDGSLRTMDVLRQVSGAMAKANVQARQTAIADLFGGPGEDAGERFLLSLAKTEFSIKGITAGMEDQLNHTNALIEANQRIERQWAGITEVLKPVRQQFELIKLRVLELFYQTIKNAIQFFKSNWGTITTGLKIVRDSVIGVTMAIMALQAPAVASFLALKAGALASSVASWTLAGSIRAIGAAIYAVPIIGWIALVVGAFTTAYHTVDEFRAGIHGVLASMKEMLNLAKPLAMIMAGMGTGNWRLVGTGVDLLKKAWSNLDIKGAFNRTYEETLAERQTSQALTPQGTEAAADPGNNSTVAGGTPGTGGFGTVSAIESSSGPVRNITVNIESFVKGGLNVVKQGSEGISESELERWFNDMIMRNIRNVESSGG